jgi:alkylation response protein AidB-like acyl-CoA dehydrogenase
MAAKTREDLIATARALFPMIRAEAEAAEKARRIPVRVFRALRAAGFFRILLPRRYGGYEFEPAVATRVAMELAAACGSTGWVASCGMSHQWMAAQFPLRCHEDLWADHPDKMVTTCFAPSGACVAADGGYRLAGTWSFASGVDYADFVLMGVRLPAAGGAPAPGFVIVPIAELVKVEDWDTMGLAATGSHAVRADDVFVPTYRSIRVADFVVSETPGRPAFETNLGRYPTFSVGAHGLSATAIGCLQGALDSFVAALADRRTGAMANMGARVADFVSVQARVGRAEAALRAAKTLLFHQLEESRLAVMEHGETLDQGARVDNRIAQGYSVQLALQGLDELWGAAGGSGIRNAEIVQRAWRDAHAVAHHAFFNWDALSAMGGQRRLGLEPQGPY